MKTEDAKRIVRDIFQKPFDKDSFVYFIKNLLNEIDESKAFHVRGYVPEIFKNFVKTYERIGTYTDPDGKRLDVMIVYLQKESTLERARTAQRNFIARYLKDRGEKDGGLVAFVSPGNSDWRFSLVKMEYKLAQTAKGNVVGKEEFTPAKRYSFIVGVNESSHTAQSSLVPIMADDEHNPTLNSLESAFNIERVTKEFFNKYRELFHRLNEAVETVIKEDDVVRKDFEEKGVNPVDFAKKLLGQIVFLYFLQKKGWFGVERKSDWGSGSKQFLRELFEKKHGEYTNFFNDILEPLFYEALRLERPGDYYSRFDCRIPFLNGGLFDPINDYNWWDTDILIPNELFSNNIRTPEGDNGNGILDVFDRYNFTVKEDEPLEKEVAVDPEMLGKVFENLLAVQDRKSKGTYYTPREIVHYMCQESLANYLATELEGKISKEDTETLIKYGEAVVEHDSRVVNEGRETGRYSFKLPQSVRDHAKLIDDKLSSIRVCDPAVGSGAFPVGMMNEIVRARNTLTAYIGKNGKRTPYHFKRQAIQHCLYGVDIDQGAVEIAKLRLWLSLVVDEEDRETIQPLPNLDYKIVQGNSLLSVEKNLFNAAQFRKLEELKPLFFNETSTSKKQKYRDQIDELISQITNGHKDFDFEVYFSEVFHEKKGFDVVIANPPYLKERDNKSVFETITKKEWGKKWHQGKMDFWYFFLHRAIDIVKSRGAISFITSRYWLNSAGAKKLIRRVKEELSFVSLVDIGKLKVFDEVAGHHMVAVYMKDKDRDEFLYKKLENDLSDIDKKEDTGNLRLRELNNSTIYSVQNEILIEETQRKFKDIVRLGDICDVSQGVVEAPDKISKKALASQPEKNVHVGDGVFVLTSKELDSLKLNSKEKKVIKEYLDPGDVFRYGVNKDDKYLIYSDKHIKERIKHDPEYRHLKSHLDKFRKYITSSNAPYGLHRPRQDKFFKQPKIVFKNMFVQPEFTYDHGGLFFGFSFSSIIEQDRSFDLKYILSILNSNLARSWFQKNCKRRGAGFDVGVQKIREFPVKAVSLKQQEPLIAVVDKILAITKNDEYLENTGKQAKVREYEKQIDQLVYKLYGLTQEEIRIIEKQ